MYNGCLHNIGTTIIQFLPVPPPNKLFKYSFVLMSEYLNSYSLIPFSLKTHPIHCSTPFYHTRTMTHTHGHAHTRTHTDTHTNTRTYTHTHSHMHVCTQAQHTPTSSHSIVTKWGFILRQLAFHIRFGIQSLHGKADRFLRLHPAAIVELESLDVDNLAKGESKEAHNTERKKGSCL